MPCWFYEKKDLRNTASYQDGISPEVEARYRREGARFILDAGTKMGLRFDTCGTGVVYFHRFYMFHSFREFHRYVTGACCLFLAGKVEETPKKCKDIIKICQSLLTPQQFAVFGDDPKEEVMTLERILLQTIKFDLRLEHPYTFLLKFAKILKGDKHKIQKMVQMAWTFINDHLCTTLCLQWEAEIIAVSLMYLASRLSKFDIQDWEGKPPGSRMKWWEWFVEGITMELMEDICHQVLDLYSTSPQKREESPPMITQRQSGTNSSNSAVSSKSPQMTVTKRNRTTPSSPIEPPMKQNRSSSRNDAASSSSSSSSSELAVNDCSSNNKRSSVTNTQQQQPPSAASTTSKTPPPSSSASSTFSNPTGPVTSQPPQQPPPPPQQQQPQHTQQQQQQQSSQQQQQISAPKIGQPIGPITGQGIVNQCSNSDSQNLDYPTNNDSFSQYNPYMPTSQMYSSSFMSHEGTQNIQSLISQSRPSQVTDLHTTAPPPQTGLVNPPTPQYLPPPPPGTNYQPPPPFPPQPTAPGYPPTSRPYPPPPSNLPPQDTNIYQYPPPGTYPPQPATGAAPTTGPPPPPPTLPGSYQAPNYPPPLQSGYQPNYPPPPPAPTPTSQGTYKVVNTGTTTTPLYQQPIPHYPPPTGYTAPPPPATTSPSRPPPARNTLNPQQTKVNPNPNPGLPTVRITGRQNRR